MKINSQLYRKEPEFKPSPCSIVDIVEISEDEYASLLDDLIEEKDYISEREELMLYDHENDVEHCILILGKGQNDGLLVQSEGFGYARYSAFIPQVRVAVNDHIKKLTDYCVSEGTQHTENGQWSVSYEELYHHFGANITDQNGNGKLLADALRQREEVNELIMTEDCIEIAYHMEYCECCQEGGIEGTMSLLSLMGCNLYDVHLDHEAHGFEFQDISSLNKNTLTEEGKKEWSDVLQAEVENIRPQEDKLCVRLTNCDPFRVLAFTEMMNGQCDAEDYDKWVQKDAEQTQEESGPVISM